MIRRLFPFILFAGLLVFPVASSSAQDVSADEHAAAKELARKAAEQWLELADAGKFGESWDEGAAMMQEQISREGWTEKGTEAKSEIDSLLSRQFSRAQYRTSLQQAPREGPFVLLEYRSEFEGGPFNEVILTVKEENAWKVAGYQVAPVQQSHSAPDTVRQGPSNR